MIGRTENERTRLQAEDWPEPGGHPSPGPVATPVAGQKSGMTPGVLEALLMMLLNLLLSPVLAAPSASTSNGQPGGDQAEACTTEFFDFAEWTFVNPIFSGNPHDLEAEAEFVHESGEEAHRQPLFHSGGQEWRLRFRHPRTGLWRFELHSPAPALDGIRGSLLIRHAPGPTADDADTPDAGESGKGQTSVGPRSVGPRSVRSGPDGNPVVLTLPVADRGFVIARGSQWGFSNGEVFVPQYVMAGGPQYYHDQPERLREDVQRLLVGHGFNGFHLPMYCRWFNIDKPSCAESGSVDPDPRTFETLEEIILAVYRAGGVVHLWMYGDNSRFENPHFLPTEGGLNGRADRRLQNHVAARLGPLPGWTMSYGYDLFEWATTDDIRAWHTHLRQKMGRHTHLLGARSGKNRPDQPFEDAEYASYEQHRPDYAAYVQTIERRPHKPSFSEDRFRVRTGYLLDDKDYDPEMTRRGFYHATMAGGVGNIWGYLMGDAVTANEGLRSSGDYPNRQELLTWKRFFATRFVPEMQRCNTLTSPDAACLRSADAELIIVYREAASELELRDLPAGRYEVVAVDTKGAAYAEIPLGVVEGRGTLRTAGKSDWIIALSRRADPHQ